MLEVEELSVSVTNGFIGRWEDTVYLSYHIEPLRFLRLKVRKNTIEILDLFDN